MFKVQYEDFTPGTYVLGKGEGKRLCENSLERVLNLAITICEDSDHVDAQTCLEDLQELKHIACIVWRAAQNAEFARENNVKI